MRGIFYHFENNILTILHFQGPPFVYDTYMPYATSYGLFGLAFDNNFSTIVTLFEINLRNGTEKLTIGSAEHSVGSTKKSGF